MKYIRSQNAGATYFFTVVTHKRKHILCQEENALLIKEVISHVKNNHPFKIDAFVLLPDHIHSIWTLPEDDNGFSKRWMLIKKGFTMRCKSRYKGKRSDSMLQKREEAVWQRRFWEHKIRDDEDYRKHVDYIHYNPVKHGLVKSPHDWRYSSFHRYVKNGLYDKDWGVNREVKFDDTVGNE